MIVLAVALAGALGTLARYLLDIGVKRLWPRHSTMPILVINVTGSFLLGLVTGLVMFHGAPITLLIIVGTGFCGSYTTFSTATYETIDLLRRKRYISGFLHVLITVVATSVAAVVGLLVAAGAD